MKSGQKRSVDADTQLSGKQALPSAHELADTLVSIASDLALIVDAQGRITHVATAQHGQIDDAQHWVGRLWADIVTAATRPKIEQLQAEALALGMSRRREVSVPHGEAEEIPVAFAAYRLRPRGPLLAVGRDLRAIATFQQRFVEAQRDIERHYERQRLAEMVYRQVFCSDQEATLVVDARTLCVVEANPAALTLFAPEGEDLIGLSLPAAMDTPSRGTLQSLLDQVAASGVPTRQHLLTLDRNLLDISVTPLRLGDAQLLSVRAASAVPACAASPCNALMRVTSAPPPSAAARATPVAPRRWRGTDTDLLNALLADGGTAATGTTGATAGGQALAAGTASGWVPSAGTGRKAGMNVQASAKDATALPMPGKLNQALAVADAQLGRRPLNELLQDLAEQAERHLIEQALARTGGELSTAAALLGLDIERLALRMFHFGIDSEGADRGPPTLLN